MKKSRLAPLALVLPIALNGCGVAVPEKDFLGLVDPNPDRRGRLENEIVAHIRCELQKGLYRVWSNQKLYASVPWLADWIPRSASSKGTTPSKPKSASATPSNPKSASGIGGSPVTANSGDGSASKIRTPETVLAGVAGQPTLIAGKPMTEGQKHPTTGKATSARVKTIPKAPKDIFNNMDGWGTAVNLTIQVDELTSLNPGVALTEPFQNAYNIAAGPSSLPFGRSALATPTISSISQNWGLGIGVSATTHATRQETIQFTYANPVLLKAAKDAFDAHPEAQACNTGMNGVLIESDLKLDQFIYDKAYIAGIGNETNVEAAWAPYSTFQDQITFTISYGGGVTPTWKFARASVDPTGQLVAVTRGEISTLTITMGQLDTSNPPSPMSPLQLKGAGAGQHAAAQIGVATAGSSNASH